MGKTKYSRLLSEELKNFKSWKYKKLLKNNRYNFKAMF